MPERVADVVVEVLAERRVGGETAWSVGSGLAIDRRHVLTAAHTVHDADLTVRCGGARERKAAIATLPSGPAIDEALDIAVLCLESELEDDVHTVFARVAEPDVDAGNVEGCRAIGFPRFRERPREPGRPPLRDTARVDGSIPMGEGVVSGRLTLQVRRAPRPIPGTGIGESEWQGMSGAAVFAGRYVIGVVTEHNVAEGADALGMVPVCALDTRPDSGDWYALLGVPDPHALPVVPESAPAWSCDPDLARALIDEFERSFADRERLAAQIKEIGARFGTFDKIVRHDRVEGLLWALDELAGNAHRSGAPHEGLADRIEGVLRETRGVSRDAAMTRLAAICHAALYAHAVESGDESSAGTELLHAFLADPELATALFPDLAREAFERRYRDIEDAYQAEVDTLRGTPPAKAKRAGYAIAGVGALAAAVLLRNGGAGVAGANLLSSAADPETFVEGKLATAATHRGEQIEQRIREIVSEALGLPAPTPARWRLRLSPGEREFTPSAPPAPVQDQVLTAADVTEALASLRGLDGVMFGSDIEPARLAVARKAARVPDDEEIVALVNLAVLGKKDALLFGRSALYLRNMNQPGRSATVPYAVLGDCEVEEQADGMQQRVRLRSQQFPSGALTLEVGWLRFPVAGLVAALDALRSRIASVRGTLSAA